MIIYKAEASVEGLADKIASGRVIAYSMPLMPWVPEERLKHQALARELFPDWVKAGANDSDLYYTKSILVTTNWNKNTDVFDKTETWMARSTPTHKPTNIEHNEKQLVGHITDCYGMTLDSQLIPDNILVDDLPNIYHLVNGAVIYKGWRDEELATRASTLIEEIEAGKKYVSMECTFTNFGYAVIGPDEKCTVLARDENTAWMTKHLRAYGGSGEHNGYKFGRLLRNITFSGKGYVDRPANPDSIIFSDAGIFNFAAASQENAIIESNGVYLNRVKTQENRENDMATEIELKAQLDEAKAQLIEAQKAKASAEEKLAKADIAKIEARVIELEGELTSTKAELEASKKTVEEITAKCADDEKKMKDEQKAKSDLEAKLAEMTQAQITSGRISILVDGGIDREVATTKVALYANLNDEQFKDISTDLIAAWPPAKKLTPAEQKKADEEAKKKAKADEEATPPENETNADETVLETATPTTEPNLAAGSEQVDEVAELRKELQQALASRLGINLENKENS